MGWWFTRKEPQAVDVDDDVVDSEAAPPDCFGQDKKKPECASCLFEVECHYMHSRAERQQALASLRTKTQELKAFDPSDEESAEAEAEEITGEIALG